MNTVIAPPTVSDRVFRFLPYTVVLLAAVLMIIPYYWMVIGAFKSLPELQAVPPRFYIENPTLDNFYNAEWTPDAPNIQQIRGLFQRYPDTPGGFMRYYGNSVFVAAVNTVIGLLVASLAAYVLAKHRFPGRNFLFIVILGSMMVPWQVTLIPGFLIVKDFGWIDTFWAMIIPAIPRAYTLFFLRQYMLSIPDELVDAARVDGAGELRIWWQIMLPLVVPAMVAMGLFLFLGEWNNLVWPSVVLQSDQMRTLPLVMSAMVDPYSPPVDLGIVMVAALLVSVPTLVLFLAFQKQFVRGIAMTGLKG
ncbi:MAG: carbohydrate ABC transporter permease [Chloroflexi bacterium]|nr:carbohydrate ABC transporter permease [Chloroflexota bacterium]